MRSHVFKIKKFTFYVIMSCIKILDLCQLFIRIDSQIIKI